MKKILFLLGIALTSVYAHAQNGLENIVVETYYISNANDTNANIDGGDLPIGSVTYRIYADMLQGYKFEAAYGVDAPPIGGAPSTGDHECRIATSTMIWNNIDFGTTSPTFTKAHASHNTVMLDSWLSVGAACAGNYGIQKSLDNGVSNIMNNYTPLVLQNNDPLAGIPLTTQDGIIAGTPEPLTAVGITSEIGVFDNATTGSVFSTWNGSWASLNGSYGPDTVDNKVLIAQVTTDGVLCFQLNIQIGTPTGGVENYVAQNPVGSEIMKPFLTWCSNGQAVINHNSSNAMLMIYPNPVNDFVRVKIIPAKESNTNSYTVTDVTGNVIYHKDLGMASDKYLETIDMSSFAKGLYFITLNSGGVTTARKIIKN
jgi:hypothetical protein